MAYASIEYASGSGTTFALTNTDGNNIPYIKESDITVKVNDVVIPYGSGGGKYLFNGAGTSIILGTSVTNAKVVISRDTSIVDPTVTYTAGSTLVASDLNNADNQIRYGLQEFSDKYDALFTGSSNLSTAFGGFLGTADTWASNDTKAATTGAIDARVDAKTTAKVKDDIIATAPVSIADDTPSAGKITVSVDAKLTELATMDQNTANSLADLTSTEVQILDGCTRTTDQLNRVDATSSIQTQIDGKQPLDAELTELATMANGTAGALADLTQTEVEILDGCTRTTAQLNYVDATSSIQTQIDAKQPLDAELTELATMGSTTASALADLSQAEVQILDGATVTTAELNVLDNIPATLTPTELGYVDGVTSSIQTQLDAKQPLDSDLTTLAGMQAGTASILAGGTALTSTLTELNQLDGKTLGETSLTTNSNTAIPTSKAVADHVTGAVTAVGGFVAIAGPTNFNATQPAQGVVVSIGDVGSGFTVSSQEITITNGAGTGNNVKITGFPTSLNGTIADDVGLQVTSDKNNSTSGSPNVHHYAYHKILAKETDVIQLSDDINDFNERYRTDTSDPGTDNHEGDLFFNKTSNTMKVYDGSNWGEVTSTGDFKYLFLCPAGGSGAPSFPGAVYDLRETSNTGTGASVTSAAQLIVSVNGVIQKANPGTNPSGLDGFVMSDSNEITFCANVTATDDIFIIQVGSAVTLNAPANNTVGTDQLQSQAVTEEKLSVTNAPTNGYFLKANASNGLTYGLVETASINGRAITLGTMGLGTQGGILYYDGSGEPTELAAGTNGYYLKTQGSGANPVWAAVSQYTTPLTTQGDILYRDGSGEQRLAAGTAGQVLTTGGAGANVSWADAASTTLGGCAYENDLTIAAGSYTIAATKGAHSVGPITNNGTVTVNGYWVIS